MIGAPVRGVLQAARSAGFNLTQAEAAPAQEHCYIWRTGDGEVVYVGKGAGTERTKQERGWKANFSPDQTGEVLGGLLARQDAEPVHLTLSGFRSTAGLDLIERGGWSGAGIDRLRAHLEGLTGLPSTRELETFLIRVCVNAGYPVGNAQNAGQWPRRDWMHFLAWVAVSASRTLRIPNR